MTARAKNNGLCRIIGGKWRGRKIKFDDAEGLRPTTDRIRETVFNWLQPYLNQRHCLDLYAGSGALGFEALSRGADDVVFVEQNAKTVKNIKENIKELKASGASVLHQDAVRWLQSAQLEKQPGQQYDLVFLDPPFHSDLLSKSCALLAAARCLTDDAVIYVEHAVDEDIEFPEHWDCLKEKCTGQVAYKLYVHKN